MTQATKDSLVEQLAALGLTRNQALAYLTLVEDDGGKGLTGYEVGARSGVPRSAVYTVLRQLEDAGAAFSFGHDPVRFAATNPAAWLEDQRRSHTSHLEALRRSLEDLPGHDRPEPIFIVRDYDQVMSRIEDMIRSASESIYLSLWPREVAALGPVLAAVAGADLHRVLHSPARVAHPPAGFSCWIDDTADDAAKATWSHKALVVVDRRRALIGGTEPGVDNHAVETTNPSLVDVATNHIILDITLMSRASGRNPVDDVAPMMRPHLA